jgi:TRAP-type C4-dicarboxylate transport system permease small subunit
MGQLARRAAAWERGLARAELMVVAAAYAALLGVALIDIVARNLLHSALPGGDVFLHHAVLWVALPGAALAVAGQRHIRLDPLAVTRFPRWIRWTHAPLNVVSSAVCASLAWAAWRFWREEWRNVPSDAAWTAVMSAILPVAFTLMTVHFLLRALAGARTGASV